MLIKYKLGDVVKVRSERVDNPASCSYDKFVGLEHYVSGEIEIKKYGDTSLLKSAMKVFKSGDILVARRNVYLKRASIVKFDGITSGDSIVLHVENKLLRKIIPFVLNTDDFWEYAEKFSDGTMSKRLSPKVLLEYEFMLPEIDKLEKLAELLWAANDTKEAYKKLLNITDELVKAQFIEMFGDITDNPFNWTVNEWKDVLLIQNGKNQKHVVDEKGIYPIYGSGGVIGYANEFTCPENTVIIGRKGTINKPIFVKEKCWNVDTAFGIIPDLNKIHFLYLYWFCILYDFEKHNRAAVLPSLTKGDLLKINMQVPPIKIQYEFADFVKHTDKSKHELEQNIYNLEKTIKALMVKNFG